MAFISVPSAPEAAPAAPSLDTLLENIPGSAVAIAILGLALVFFLAKFERSLRQAPARRPYRNKHRDQVVTYRVPTSSTRSPGTTHAPGSDHFQLVANAEFDRVPLMIRSEAKILPILERITRQIGGGHRVMAQVAMGEILCAKGADGKRDFQSDANRAINAKRLDFIIIDRKGYLVAAIEYQGRGHHLSDKAFMRDAVKREALRKAGINLIELPPEVDEATIRARLIKATDLPLQPMAETRGARQSA